MANDLIEMSDIVMGGKPHIRERRISVENIAVLHNNGWEVEQIGGELELTPAQIYAALSYYFDHQEEIDEKILQAGDYVIKHGQSMQSLREKINKRRG